MEARKVGLVQLTCCNGSCTRSLFEDQLGRSACMSGTPAINNIRLQLNGRSACCRKNAWTPDTAGCLAFRIRHRQQTGCSSGFCEVGWRPEGDIEKMAIWRRLDLTEPPPEYAMGVKLLLCRGAPERMGATTP